MYYYAAINIATGGYVEIPKSLLNLGFTRYEAQVYLALVAENPLNGSQLSRASGVPRANIYNVLDTLKSREIVILVEKNLYAPIPPEELFKRLQIQKDYDLSVFKDITDEIKTRTVEEHIWSITGYDNVLNKAREMIAAAEHEVFIRVFPEEGDVLKTDLIDARDRGVTIKYVSLGPAPVVFDFQVIHPDIESLYQVMNGRSINLVVDEQEVITGRLDEGPGKKTSSAWAKNHWLAFATRDAMRHDFYHVFFHKTYELGEQLSDHEKELYRNIKRNFWTSLPVQE